MKPNREELERAHYNGLTTADKGALLDAKARGAEWVARDKDDELVGFRLSTRFLSRLRSSHDGSWSKKDRGKERER